jgi:hypothetical protein
MADPFKDIKPIPLGPSQPMALQDPLGGGGGGISPQAMRQVLAQLMTGGGGKRFVPYNELALSPQSRGLVTGAGWKGRDATINYDDVNYTDRTHARALDRLLRDYPDAATALDAYPERHIGFMTDLPRARF